MNRMCFIILFLFSCNNGREVKTDAEYYGGKDLYDKKCSSCHSFLTMEGLNQTSLDQMRQLPFKELYSKVGDVKNDSNHMIKPLNINDLSDSDIKKIVLYIVKTAQPKP